MLYPWREAEIGEPLIVRTVDLEHSFWIVPVNLEGKVLGQIEVDKDGKILGHSYFYHSLDYQSMCPTVVTRISSEEAYLQAESIMKKYQNAEFSEPLYVHDGARSRLAWMIEVRFRDKLESRIFVTPGYVYQRKPGETRETGLRGKKKQT